MESIAAERLNKIGKNPSLVSQREDLQSDLKAVSELLTMSILENDHDSESSCPDALDVRKGLPRPKSESCFRLSLMTDFTSSIRTTAAALATSSPSEADRSSTTAAAAIPPSATTSSSDRGNNTHPTSSTTTDKNSHLDPQEAAKAPEAVKESKSTFNLHSLLH
jgi:hypothetical protein